MRVPKPTTIDFETFGVEGRPHYPPVPVGVSIKQWGKKPRYYAWGHVEGNNCTWPEAKKALEAAWTNPDGILCQNGKFDVDVAEVHMDMPLPKWDAVHDTMFLLFLDDPHQLEIGLKPSAERLLGLPPDEQDVVAEWLIEHQPVPGIKISKSRASDHYAQKYLPFAPGKIVGDYANGDTDRTEQLFKLLYEKTIKRGMLEAYNRERRLMPCLLDMERTGLPVNLAALTKDIEIYTQWHEKVTQWLRTKLKSPELNLDSGSQLMEALVHSGLVDPDTVPLTKTGKLQTNKEALDQCLTDNVVKAMLKYRTQLGTCLQTFMRPWCATAKKSGGLIFTNWNQVKAPSGDANVGTRTGRLSSTPNFQNIPKEFIPIWQHETSDKSKAKMLPRCPLKGLPSLPRVRRYIKPFDGEVFIDRDYSQQEPRILGHFEGGALMEAYVANPWLDVHDHARDELGLMGLHYDRKPVKNTNLGLIYGMGVGKLAAKNGMTVEDSKQLKTSILNIYPGLKEMYQEMKLRSKMKQPIRTWGGREYYCEEPRVVDGRLREFDYKLVNVLIQGSAADCTKEAILRFYERKKPSWKLLLNVHDQLTSSVPRRERDEAMQVMKECMESVEFDVPMLSEGSWSDESWEDLVDYDKRGKKV